MRRVEGGPPGPVKQEGYAGPLSWRKSSVDRGNGSLREWSWAVLRKQCMILSVGKPRVEWHPQLLARMGSAPVPTKVLESQGMQWAVCDPAENTQ